MQVTAIAGSTVNFFLGIIYTSVAVFTENINY